MSIIEIAYDKALEGEEFNKIDVSTIPSEIIPVCPEKVSDWIDDGIEVEEELVSLAKRIARLPCLHLLTTLNLTRRSAEFVQQICLA